jgi:antitoxin CptB
MIEETRPAGETPDIRLRRLRMRSWHRGIREMDLVLGGFADGALPGLAPEALDAYEALLVENDHDIYGWIAGRAEAPAGHAVIVGRIRAFHGAG